MKIICKKKLTEFLLKIFAEFNYMNINILLTLPTNDGSDSKMERLNPGNCLDSAGNS
jgi:hypothetical protein